MSLILDGTNGVTFPNSTVQAVAGLPTTGGNLSGSLAFTASNAGVTFNNSSALTNSTLNDYETGTWTPTIKFNGNSTGVTYSVQSGTYTKIGRIVTITFWLTLTSKGSSTGAITFTGMPFTAVPGAGYPAVGVLNGDGGMSSQPLGTYGLVWSDLLIYWRYNGTTGFLPMQDTNITNGSTIYGSFTYQANF